MTPGWREHREAHEELREAAHFLEDEPMGRAGEVSEIATVAVLYAGDLSAYMTGTVAEVSGGRFM